MNTMFLPLLVIVGLGLAPGQGSASEIIDRGSYLEECAQEPIDLDIVLDSSRSIKAQDFIKTKQFLHDFLDYFVIGQGRNDVRVAIIPFGNGIYPQIAFNLSTYATKSDVLNAVMNIEHMKGGRTDTGDAIEYMYKYQMTPAQTRSWAAKMTVVVTDGNSQRASHTAQMAAEARASNDISMYAVGIGNVDMSELLNIAGDNDRVTAVKNFDSLDSVKSILAKKTCVRKAKPTTTTPMPQTSCGEANPADINFVFSPADMGADGTSWTTSFISNVVDTEDMDVGFRYGVVSGSCPDDEGFALNRYNNPGAIHRRLQEYDSIRMPKLSQRVAEDGFTSQNGGRPEARNVAVLFASAGKKGGALRREVADLASQGIEVYIASPNGSPVTIPGAQTLYGTSSRQQSEDFISRLCPT